MEKMQLCTLIRKARDEIGLTREKVSEYIGVSATTVMRWEKGENKPFFIEIVKLSEILNKPLSYFAGKAEVAPPAPLKASGLFQALADHSELIEVLIQLPKDSPLWDEFKQEVEIELEELRREKSAKQA